MNSFEKSQRTDLGLAICAVRHRGERVSIDTIAAYADCSRQLINNIERKALAKVRRLLKKKGLSGDLAEALRG